MAWPKGRKPSAATIRKAKATRARNRKANGNGVVHRTVNRKTTDRSSLRIEYNGAIVTVEGSPFQVQVIAERFLKLEPEATRGR